MQSMIIQNNIERLGTMISAFDEDLNEIKLSMIHYSGNIERFFENIRTSVEEKLKKDIEASNNKLIRLNANDIEDHIVREYEVVDDISSNHLNQYLGFATENDQYETKSYPPSNTNKHDNNIVKNQAQNSNNNNNSKRSNSKSVGRRSLQRQKPINCNDQENNNNANNANNTNNYNNNRQNRPKNSNNKTHSHNTSRSNNSNSSQVHQSHNSNPNNTNQNRNRNVNFQEARHQNPKR
jgi:hypothetical protein